MNTKLIFLIGVILQLSMPAWGRLQVIQLDSLSFYKKMGIDLSARTWTKEELGSSYIPLQIFAHEESLQLESGYWLKSFPRKNRVWYKAIVSSASGGKYYVRPGVNPNSHVFVFHRDSLIKSQPFGFFLASGDLEIPTAAHFFSLNFSPNDTLTLVLSNDPIFPLPLTLSWEFRTESSFQYFQARCLFMQVLFHGAFWIMILYVFLLWITNRDQAYLWYLAYMFCLSFVYFVGKELIRVFPLPTLVFAKSLFDIAASFPLFIVLLYFTFARHFLRLNQLLPHVDHALKWFVRVQFIALPLLIYLNVAVFPNSPVQLLVMIVDIGATVWLVIKLFNTQNYLARIFIVGTLILILGGLLNLGLTIFELFPNHQEDYIFQVGVLLEVLVFSYGLGVRSNLAEREKREAQAQLLEQQAQINQRLEDEVENRTQDLNQKNMALTSALEKLKKAQSQLVASERMASVGQLTAGVAHEINNPINFVIGNIDPLKRDLEDILEIVQQVQQSGSKGEQFSEQGSHGEEVDEIVEEIMALMEGIEEGAIRIRDIVRSLRTFSRIQEEEFKLVDIHEGLDSTLLLLQHKLEGRIHVEKYYGELPLIEGLPGKLNQVFMNVLVNAIQAIPREGKIEIRTAWDREKEQVDVYIQDSGIGIDENIKERIFEPFFTTKEEGEGMGLGLSISLGIVEQHRGKLSVESLPGKGALFSLHFPNP